MRFKKILPFFAVIIAIIFLVTLLFETNGFGGRVPGFSKEGYGVSGVDTTPLFGKTLFIGVGIVASILLMMSIFTIFSFG